MTECLRRWILAIAIGVPLSLAMTLLLFVAPFGGTKRATSQSWRWLGERPADWTAPDDDPNSMIPVGAAIDVFSTPGVMVRLESFIFGGTGVSQDRMSLAIGAPFISFVTGDGGIILPAGVQISPDLPTNPRWRGIIANAIFFTLLAYGILLLGSNVKHAMRRRQKRCIHCGYPMPDPLPRCPECGMATRSSMTSQRTTI